MNLCICVKSVPDTASVAFDSENGTLRRTGTAAMLNPCDMVAVQAAMQCAALRGAAIDAVSMGPAEPGETALRTALSMGCRQAYLLSSPLFSGADVPATAYTLSRFFALHPYDLIFCGKHSLDGDTGQVGAYLAELLCLPHAAGVCEIQTVQDGYVTVQQRLENELLTTSLRMPCLLIIENDMAFPQPPAITGVLRAKRQAIPHLGEQALCAEPARCGTAGSFTRVKKIFVPQLHTKCTMLDEHTLHLLLPVISPE